MKYVIRSADGTEYGPVDQEVIAQWVEDGRVKVDTPMRNTLMKTWTTAGKVPFVSDLIKERAALAADEAAEAEADADFSGGPGQAPTSMLHSSGENFAPAGPLQRLMAWVFDIAATFGVGLFIAWTVAYFQERLGEPLYTNLCIGVGVGFSFYFFMYYVLGFGFKAQTFGQWFWGIMIIRPDGRPVFAGRAFVYTILHIILFPTTFLFYAIVPGRRALQELLTGTRVIKITLRR